MLNKKRLAMMAVAASMVLPTNLTYLSVATPVTVFAATNTATTLPTAESGTITLADDTEYNLDTTIEISENVTLNLNGQKITSSASIGFKIVENGSLTIEGAGSIEATTGTPIALTGAGTLTITGTEDNQVTIEAKADKAAIGLGSGAVGSEITLTYAQIKSPKFGININGNIEDANTTTKLTLTNTTVDGIYQAGSVETKVIDSTVSSAENGIEIRAGKLEVSGQSTVSSTKASDLTLKGNDNGATTSGAGIAIARHTTGQAIEVTIKGDPDKDADENPKIEGIAGLIISDPENKGKEDITIAVNNSTLTGSSYDVAYTSDIPFTLTDTTLTNDTIQKVTAGDDGSVTQAEDAEEIPYTIVNSTISSDTITNIAGKDEEENPKETVNISAEDEALKSILSDLPVEAFATDGLTEETLKAALETKSETTITLDDGTTVAPKYGYELTGLKGFKAKADEISLIAEDGEDIVIAVKLKSDSNIKLTTGGEETNDEDPAGNEGDPTPLNEVEEVEGDGVAGDEGNDDNDGEETPTEDVTEYVDLETLKGESEGANPTAINDYLAKKDTLQDYVVDTANTKLPDEGLTTEDPLTITGSDKDVELDKNGFIVVKLKEKTDGGEEENPPVVNPSRPSSSKPKPKPEEPAEPTTPATPTTMYRLYNRLTGEHLFTTDKNERDNLLTSDTWKDEGEGWTAPSVSDYPVYRLLNPNTSDHHYTTDKNEFDTLPSYGWVAEGVAFYSADKDNPENVILHRLYNPNAQGAGMHHYTADTNERDTLVAQGWKYEGTAWAGLKN